MSFGWVILIAIFSFASCAIGAPSQHMVGVVQKLSEAARSEVHSGAISGVTVALVAQGEILFVEGFGYANKQKRRPARANTVYRAGSISKLFTALAAMQLAEAGRLDIDKPVTEFLPDFRVVVP